MNFISYSFNCNSVTYVSSHHICVSRRLTTMKPNEIFRDRWDLCIYLNPELHYCDAMHTHTTLSLVHNVREERTKKKKKRTNRDYIFSIDPKTWWPINIVHPGLFKCNFVLSYVPIISRIMNYFLRKSYGFFFIIRERYLDITEHQVTLTFVPYLYF